MAMQSNSERAAGIGNWFDEELVNSKHLVKN